MAGLGLFLLTPGGEKIPVEVKPDAVVGDIRRIAKDHLKISIAYLGFQGIPLDDKIPLADSGVSQQATLSFEIGWKVPNNTVLRDAVKITVEGGDIQKYIRENCGSDTSIPTVFDIGYWDTSCITDMSGLFANTSFNEDISRWDTSSVINMESMFMRNRHFNQDIGNWNTSAVKNMRTMFCGATRFNQDISNWDISNVFSMIQMFPINPGEHIVDTVKLWEGRYHYVVFKHFIHKRVSWFEPYPLIQK